MTTDTVPHAAYLHIVNTPPCSCSPEQYGLPDSLWHYAAASGVAATILEDRDRGWHTGEKTWRHLRWHLNGGKPSSRCPQCDAYGCGYDAINDICPTREGYEASR